ncbi:YgiT-type zinc finger protein [Candidatus Woesearchaeota archaeon]|nr:YgiT-type zinc finger protein [Candidatus Woesearchaeota archaeon]
MEITKCDECNGKVVKKNVDFKLYGESLGKFPAYVCTKCSEEIFDEETFDKIDETAKKKCLWGLGANGKVMRILKIRIE